MEDVLEHVADPEKVMKECYRVLRSKGRIIVKFPSFLMMGAHHLDRALNLPGLHYILPMKTWASGLNYLLLNSEKILSYEPFSEVISTKYCRAVTRDLNGLDFCHFNKMIEDINFKKHFLGLVPCDFRYRKARISKIIYNLAYSISSLREFLSSFILFIGEK